MTRKYKLMVFIGRFQPVHIGHIQVIEHALTLADEVLILIGSANQPRTEKNPWTFGERADMIVDSLASYAYEQRVIIRPLQDMKYNDQKWSASVQRIVESVYTGSPSNVALIGHSKDETSYYLKMFPQWDLVEHTLNESVNATDIRRIIFEGMSMKFLTNVVPLEVSQKIERFKQTDTFHNLKTEYDMIKKYKKAWDVAPYPVTFVATDAVVMQSGHILLIERGAAPGKGLMALPGGFLNQNEFIQDGMLRELREETKIKVPLPVLRGNIKASRVFDHPNRDPRGRMITHAFAIELPAGELPPIKGSDDARKAMWVPIADIKEEELYADHFHIIHHFLGAR